MSHWANTAQTDHVTLWPCSTTSLFSCQKQDQASRPSLKTKTETLDIKTKIKNKTLELKTKTKTFKIQSRDQDPSLENPMSDLNYKYKY